MAQRASFLPSLRTVVRLAVGSIVAAIPDRPDTTLGEAIESERHGEISTPVPQPHSVGQDVSDLPALLDAAGERGPYVLAFFGRLREAQNLLAESLRAKKLMRTNSGHHVHLEQPQIVSDATREVVEAVRAGCTALPCPGVPPKPAPSPAASGSPSA